LDNYDENTDDECGEEEEYYEEPGDPDYEFDDYSVGYPTEYDTHECEGNITLQSQRNSG
jgi:hypothetical protein